MRVVQDPAPDDLLPYGGLAARKDLPILVTAVREKCRWLVTFDMRHYLPGHPEVEVVRPGGFVPNIRDLFSRLGQ